MKCKYLIQDIKGAMSRILYGKKNEMVYIVSRNIDMVLVMNINGETFFVNEKLLSDVLLPLS
jgi:hypothetical protein